ncbi:hypothetical protein BDQ17DRAFT_1329793 [Cyathus striatus]|nr:hypothetical protein BDQ17DRAFT_1329793 [Cyathus striatus]
MLELANTETRVEPRGTMYEERTSILAHRYKHPSAVSHNTISHSHQAPPHSTKRRKVTCLSWDSANITLRELLMGAWPITNTNTILPYTERAGAEAIYDELFPLTTELDDTPYVRRELIYGHSPLPVMVPVYAAGWTLTKSEIIRKYRIKSYCAEEVNVPLLKRWKMIGFKNKYKKDPLIRFPVIRDRTTRDFLFVFATNNSVENMKSFLEREEEIFEVMCELFGIVDPEDITKIRGRYKWHRFMATEYVVPSEAHRDTPANLFMNGSEDGIDWSYDFNTDYTADSD